MRYDIIQTNSLFSSLQRIQTQLQETEVRKLQQDEEKGKQKEKTQVTAKVTQMKGET